MKKTKIVISVDTDFQEDLYEEEKQFHRETFNFIADKLDLSEEASEFEDDIMFNIKLGNEKLFKKKDFKDLGDLKIGINYQEDSK